MLRGVAGAHRALSHGQVKPADHAFDIGHHQIKVRALRDGGFGDHALDRLGHQNRLGDHPDRQNDHRRNGGEQRHIGSVIGGQGVQVAHIALTGREGAGAAQNEPEGGKRENRENKPKNRHGGSDTV